MISLAGRDILHAWGKFVFTGVGLGLLIGVTLTMAGVYRGMVDDAHALLANSGAVMMKITSSTNITSARGGTLISAIGPPLLPLLKAMTGSV